MQDYETSGAWTGEDPATQTALPPSGNMQSGASEGLAGPHIVARMPDLETEVAVPADGSARSEGRLISRRWATRLLVGGAVLLVLAAIVGWRLERGGKIEGGTHPRPDAPPAPAWDPQTAQQKPATHLQPLAPDLSLDVDVPDGELDFMNAPSGSGLKPRGAAAAPSPGPAQGNLETRNWDHLPKQPALKGEPPAPRVSGLPGRRAWDMPAPTNNNGYPSAAPKRTDAFQSPPNVSRGMMPDPANRRADMQAAVNGPMSVGTPGHLQPGVARLEGFIQEPPVRITDDRNRPGAY